MTEETKAARAKHPDKRTENDWDLLLVAYEIPRHCHEGLTQYILRGRMVGHFLTYMLEGRLFDAVAHADEENRAALTQYVRFLVNCAPSGCFGSPAKVERWREIGGLIGILEAEAAPR